LQKIFSIRGLHSSINVLKYALKNRFCPWVVRFLMVSLEFFIDVIFLPHYGSGVDSASNRNEYQEYFMGVKAAGA
jgi:hypothetical protein